MESWKIATIGLTSISLLWNIANTVYTSSSNKRNTKRLVNLEEFRARVRDPLEDVLRRGEAVIRELRQISEQPNFPANIEDTLVAHNRELMGCMSEIQDRLIDADESKFASGFNWLDMYDPAEDQIMNLMNGVLDIQDSPNNRAGCMRRCKAEFRKFKKAVTSKIETEVSRLAC